MSVEAITGDGMTPTQIAGQWFITQGGETIRGPFASSADAWRWIDRNEPKLPGAGHIRKTRVLRLDRVRIALKQLMKDRSLSDLDRRFVKAMAKSAGSAVTDLMVTETDAARWERLAAKAGQRR